MSIQPEPTKLFDGFKESVTVKLIFIATLILVLLVPSALVNNLITERASRQDEVITQVSSDWAGDQLIKGPVLVIPYKKEIKGIDTSNQPNMHEVIENLYVLPDNLNIRAKLNHEVLHRGIFSVAVYRSAVKIGGNFLPADLNILGIAPAQLLLNKARLIFGITDLKGLKNNPQIKAAGQTLTAEPVTDASVFGDGLQAAIDLSTVKDAAFSFNYELQLSGSQDLQFLHLGKTTDVEVQGTWQSPSFDGRYLPDTRSITNDGFKAHWRMLYYNRRFPQQWVKNDDLLSDNKKLSDAIFGVKLRLPVDQYQKTMRTSKYALLIISLTFISLFLTEVIRKQKVHIFNYVLIGVSMIIYYSLLLSFSEQMGYNYAYILASVATIALVSGFIASLLKNKGAAWLFAAILSVFYTFIFVIIQMEDFALLIGSIALFIIVGILMYFSNRINWEKH